MATSADNALARSAAERIRNRPRIQTAAAARERVSLWERLVLLYKLVLWANETSLRVEGAPLQRRSEIARRYFWRDY